MRCIHWAMEPASKMDLLIPFINHDHVHKLQSFEQISEPRRNNHKEIPQFIKGEAVTVIMEQIQDLLESSLSEPMRDASQNRDVQISMIVPAIMNQRIKVWIQEVSGGLRSWLGSRLTANTNDIRNPLRDRIWGSESSGNTKGEDDSDESAHTRANCNKWQNH